MATDQGTDDGIDFDDDDDDAADDNSTATATGGDDKGDGKGKETGPSKMVSRAELERVIRQRDRYKAAARGNQQPADDDDDEDEPAKATKTKADPAASRAATKAARELEKTRGEVGKMRTAMINSEAKQAFLAAGAVIPEGDAGKQALARLTRLLDHDDIEFDGVDVTGIEDQVADIKRDMPHLFKSDRKRVTKIKGSNTAGTQDAGGKTKSSAQRLAESLLGTGQ